MSVLQSLVSAPSSLAPPAETAGLLRSLVPEALQHPVIAIVCGTGLAGLAELLEDRVDLPYDRIGFPASTGTSCYRALAACGES